MDRLRTWRRGKTDASTPSPSPARDGLLNAATRVTVGDLIALQHHAGKIDLAHAPAARGRLTGNHASRFRGRGMDYQESRSYQPGDDIRSMDWRVTARTGKPYTKVYEEERERPVVLFLDLNPGMFFGTRGTLKSVVAARAASLIGWAAAARGDRVGGMLFNGGHRELPPRGGRHGVLRLIRQLVELTDPLRMIDAPAHSTTMNTALARLRRVSRPGSLIILLSDFYAIDEETGKHLLRLRQHSDVAAVQIVDPLELSVPLPARYGVTDGNRVDILDLRSNNARRAYQDYFRRHHEAIANLTCSRAISLLRLSTEDDVAARLRSHFATPIIMPALVRRAA